MGLSWLAGRSWNADVTRDERFFCAVLFQYLRNNGNQIKKLVQQINDCPQNEKKLKPVLDLLANWEIGYEVCFYRDLWHLQKHHDWQPDNGETIRLSTQSVDKEGYSPKRTYDLCLFSDDYIVIIEAKAHETFDNKQMDTFEEDISHVSKLTGIRTENVLLVGLASAEYLRRCRSETRQRFHALISWKQVKHLFEDDIFHRADRLRYEK